MKHKEKKFAYGFMFSLFSREKKQCIKENVEIFCLFLKRKTREKIIEIVKEN